MHPAISPSNFRPPPIPAANPPSSIPLLLPVFILFFILFCFLSIFLFRDLLYYLSAARSSVATGGGESAVAQQSTKAGLDPAIIASFPMFRYAEVRRLMEGKYGGECAVCISEFAAGDVIRLLTVCCHAFHPGCIDSWLVSHRTCPICRSNLEEEPDDATLTAMREVVASGGGDSYVISIHAEGEGAAGEGREGLGNMLMMERGAVERNSGMSITGYGLGR